MDINTVTLVGRLAEDVKYKEGTGGESGTASRAVARLIVNRPPGKDKAGKSKERAYDAIQIVGWGKHADNMATYTSKGKELAITGQIRVNSVAPTTVNGEWKNYFEVQISTLSFGRDSNTAKAMKVYQSSEGSLTAAQVAIAQGSNSFAETIADPEIRKVLEGIVNAGLSAPAPTQPEETQEEEPASDTEVETPFTEA